MRIDVGVSDMKKLMDGIEGDIAGASTGAMRDTTTRAKQ